MSTAGMVIVMVIHAAVWCIVGWKVRAVYEEGEENRDVVAAVVTSAVLAVILVAVVVAWAS